MKRTIKKIIINIMSIFKIKKIVNNIFAKTVAKPYTICYYVVSFKMKIHKVVGYPTTLFVKRGFNE